MNKYTKIKFSDGTFAFRNNDTGVVYYNNGRMKDKDGRMSNYDDPSIKKLFEPKTSQNKSSSFQQEALRRASVPFGPGAQAYYMSAPPKVDVVEYDNSDYGKKNNAGQAIGAAASIPIAATVFAAPEFIPKVLTNPYVQAGMNSLWITDLTKRAANGTLGSGITGLAQGKVDANNLVTDAFDLMGVPSLTRGATKLYYKAKPLAKEVSNTVKSIKPLTRNTVVATAIRFQTRPESLRAVYNAFRNSEWSNFLATRNGDYYYRMVGPTKESYAPESKYFLSHTTPWEEFSGLQNPSDPNGINKLYEFPTETFGKLKSTTSNGVPTNYDVTEMGRKHLLYGKYASGKRGLVRMLSDKDANTLGVSPFGAGLLERPLKENGLYDDFPIYENVGFGNQTVIKGRTLQEAINNSTYNVFKQTPSGIQRTLHMKKAEFNPQKISSVGWNNTWYY